MATELVNSWASPSFFKQGEDAEAMFARMAKAIVDLDNLSKKAEGMMSQANSIKEVVTAQNTLVDANGKLINNYNALNGKYKEAMQLMAVQNGHSKETVQVQREILKLRTDEERVAQKGLATKRQEAKVLKDITDERALLRKALLDEEVRYSNLFLTQGKANKLTEESKVRVLALRKTLDEVNQSIGRYGDNVGNYAGRFNSLGNAVQQVGRELPNFAISARTGIQALSNNLPILAEEISRVRVQNAALRAEGKPTVSLFKQLAGAVINWQTALIVGITLVTAYADEIGDFFTELFKGKKAIDSLKASVENLNKAYESPELKAAVVDVNELRINVQLAKEGLLDKDKVLHQYNTTLGKTIGQVTDLDGAEKALTAGGEAYIRMTLFKAAANLALEEAAKKALEAENNRIKKAEAFASTIEKLDKLLPTRDDPDDENLFGLTPSSQLKARQAQEKRRQDAIAENEKDMATQEKIAKTFQQRAAEIAKKNKFDFFGGSQDEKVKKVKDDSEKEAKARQKALDEETELELRKLKARYEQRQALAEDAFKDEKRSLKERLINLDKALLDEVSVVQINGAIHHKTKEEIEKEITELTLKYAKLRTDITDKEGKEQIAQAQRNLKSITGNGQGQTRAEFEKEQKEKFDIIQNYAQAGIDTARGISDVNNEITRQRVAKIDEEIEAINKRTAAEIDGFERQGLSAVELERKKADARARADAKIAQLEEQKKRRIQKAAQFEKAITIAQIITETALAVVRALGSKPYTPANIALAVATGVAGAAQLAVAVATPIPGYEEGTKGKPHKGGPAMLFEGNKPELVIEPGGKAWVGSTEGVYNLSRGSEVLNQEQILEISRRYTLGLPMLVPQNNSSLNTEKLEQGLKEVKDAIRQTPRTAVNITGDGISHLVRNGSNTLNFKHNIKYD